MQEALDVLRAREESEPVLLRAFPKSLRAMLEGNREESLAALRTIISPDFRDPEGLYYAVRQLAYLGERAQALAGLARVVDEGFFCYSTFARDPWLDPLRAEGEFIKILRKAEARHREALAAFLAAGGDRVLGLKLS